MCQHNSEPVKGPKIGYRIYRRRETVLKSFYNHNPITPVGVTVAAEKLPFHAFRCLKDVLYWWNNPQYPAPREQDTEVWKVKLSGKVMQGDWDDPRVKTYTATRLTTIKRVTAPWEGK